MTNEFTNQNNKSACVSGANDARQRVVAHGADALQSAPASNTGGLVSEAHSHFVMVDGKLKEIPLKRGRSTAAFIDTLTFTVKEDVFLRPDQLGTEEEIACNVSADLADIMGFGLFAKQNGRNGYTTSYKLGSETANYGFVAMGGAKQRGTVCIYFTGEGLVAAKDGWESRLYHFIKDYAPFARITRCDLAHDFLNGEYMPERALKDWENGLYTSRQSCPVAECVGSDWLINEGRGKTFYVGSRKNSSRFARIYEKGKQLGDKESPWVRVELEMKNRDLIIPHEVLIEPGRFLTGAYPIFEQLFQEFDEVIAKPERIKKIQDVGHEHVLKYASMQVSPAIKMLMEMGFTDSQIVETLLNERAKLPKRLTPEAFDCSYINVAFIHEHKRLPYSEFELLEKLSTELNPPKRMTHRTYDEYVELKQRNEFPMLVGKANKRMSHDEYMYDRYATPYSILNPDFKRT